MAQANEADGVRVVMSPVQLVAVLTGQSIDSGATMTNRLWGGLQLVGGVLEMFGAAALCVLPEPTGASKAGCIVFGAHGSDVAAAGLRQVWTGRDTATLTQQGVTKLAEVMKASPDEANKIGLSLEIGVGFGVAGMLKAARVSSVTLGRISLAQHEAETATARIGGHTIRKHIGRTDAELRARLQAEPRRDAVSTFTNLRLAEWAISRVMRANAPRIEDWAKASPRRTLILTENVGRSVGRVLLRETNKIKEGGRVLVVLKYETYKGMPYYVLTAYVVS